MRAAIDDVQIAPEQYSIPQFSAVAHGINRRLVFDCQQYLRQHFSLSCSDLKSFYDRFFHSSASLALQRLEIRLLEIIIMLDTIQCMSHMFRTAYGDYNLTYRGYIIPDDFRHFMVRLCQGNGSATQIWLNISSIVFSAL